MIFLAIFSAMWREHESFSGHLFFLKSKQDQCQNLHFQRHFVHFLQLEHHYFHPSKPRLLLQPTITHYNTIPISSWRSCISFERGRAKTFSLSALTPKIKRYNASLLNTGPYRRLNISTYRLS